MSLSKLVPALILSLAAMLHSSNAIAESSGAELYEVRSYLLGEKSDAAAIDGYLRDALLPALKRAGVGPVGVFTNSKSDESGSKRIVVVIPYKNSDHILKVKDSLAGDHQLSSDAKNYLDRESKNPPFTRIRSELLVAMDCMSNAKVPAGTLDNPNRVYELRLYESPNERLGALKVEMFNSGEVPIFLDCGIQPIFIGECIVGPQTPSLTYLTMYPSEEARLKSWVDFRVHPDWQVLSKVEKYQGTVTHIDKFVLVPMPYSEM